MNRRTFTKLIGLGLAAVGSGSVSRQLLSPSDVPTFYYADGYHGGIHGHMPPGAWRDILNTMRRVPDWKLCLEIEPASWEVLRRDDPAAYQELKGYLVAPPSEARVEMMSVTFAQPYGWAIGGESNIRQLQRGLEITRRHFPEAQLDTYAVQEPCWASCLPQILRSLGFTGAVLKNPATAWGGYAAGRYDEDLVDWVGPDGSALPAAPRYACEDLVNTWETESVNATPAFARECAANGIAHPAGMGFQDLGWSAAPKVAGDYIEYVTWREYIHTVAEAPSKRWKFGIEDIQVTLPWGEQTLQTVARQARSAENRLLVAEKTGALAWLEQGSAWPTKALREAWDHLLWAQHHDAWITATTRSGREAWAFQVASDTMNAEETADAIIEEAAAALAGPSQSAAAQIPLEMQWGRVINTLGTERDDLAEVLLATDRGTQGVRVTDATGDVVLSQVVPRRTYDASPADQNGDESINAATVLFRASVPALGYASYRFEPLYAGRQQEERRGATRARTESNGIVVLESDRYRLQLDPSRGGAVTSFRIKEEDRELCDPTSECLFNEYRGYFTEQEKWRSSTEQKAEIAILEQGPVRARVRIEGKVGGCPYQTVITLVEGQRRIDVQARFEYGDETWIGAPWDIDPKRQRTQGKRSQNDGRWKLQALFPVKGENQAIYKNAAYDVCRSRHADTSFQHWNEIKHNIILDWVDLVDDREERGLAFLSDHTTAYSYGPGRPLGLVMGWGWDGGFWWGKCPLEGVQEVCYSLLPHRGRWDEAHLSREASSWKEPLVTQLMDGAPSSGSEARSLIGVSEGLAVPTLLVEEGHVLIRLFNAESAASEHTVSLRAKPSRVDLVELDGRSIRQLEVQGGADGRHEVKLPVPRFGLRTLRVS